MDGGWPHQRNEEEELETDWSPHDDGQLPVGVKVQFELLYYRLSSRVQCSILTAYMRKVCENQELY